MTPDQLRRFEAKCMVEPNTGCILWFGAQTTNGYGEMAVGRKGLPGRVAYTHRLAYEHWRGPIPEGLSLDHLCRQRCCCNPDHLEAVTHQVNMSRCDKEASGRRNRSKTHCKRGHPFDERNTFVRPTGARRCRRCEADAMKRRRERLGLTPPTGPDDDNDEGSDEQENAA